MGLIGGVESPPSPPEWPAVADPAIIPSGEQTGKVQEAECLRSKSVGEWVKDRVPPPSGDPGSSRKQERGGAKPLKCQLILNRPTRLDRFPRLRYNFAPDGGGRQTPRMIVENHQEAMG